MEVTLATSVRLRFDLDSAALLGQDVVDGLNEDGVGEEGIKGSADNLDVFGEEGGSSSLAEADLTVLAYAWKEGISMLITTGM